MYTPFVRLIFVLFGLVMAWNSFSDENYQSTLLFAFAVALTIWGYFKNGTVYLAYNQLKKQNFEKAEALLKKIKSPDNLKTQQKAYYHFSKGFINLEKGKLDLSLEHFRKSINIGLRTQNDKAIALLKVALIEIKNNNISEASNLLKQINQLKHKSALNQEVEKLKEIILTSED